MSGNEKRKNRLFSFRYLIYDLIKITAGIPGLIWFRPKRYYESEEAKKRIRGGALVISNHYGFFDPLYLMFAVWYRRHHFVCGREFFDGKWRYLFKAFLCIPVDRENFSMDSLRRITDELRAGSLVTIFPEGHISREPGGMSSFKTGMVLMALRGKAPVIPIYVQPRPRFYSCLRFAIGNPIDIVSLYGERPTLSQIEEIARNLRDKEEELKTLIK
ncbi:MAG: 1-acyl-sn-glycerol-3-phosphate acyltransferase [Clostridia bacterium]|nr:1-acyl-sn-glycerol-3-phosphate acyltransferase [Clostridia bacterium]MBP5270537.1 1-acyl-sn-glycerol-3-phosphate acyltransferase [Clostridia bacterium]